MLRLNITQKFIGYLMLFSVIPLVVVGVVAYSTSTNLLRDENDRHTRQVVRDQLDYLELQQGQIESLLANISGVETVRAALRNDAEVGTDTYTRLSTQAEIGYILNGYINIRGLVSIDLFTTSGTHYTVGDTLVTDAINNEVMDRIFSEALAGDGAVVWIGIEDNVNPNSVAQQVVTAAVVLSEFDRDALEQVPVALLMVNFDPDEFYQHFNSVDLGENGALNVIDGQGRLVYHPDRAHIGTLADEALTERLAGWQDATTPRTLDEVSVDGTEVAASYVYSPASGWTVVSLVPLETLADRIAVIRNAVAYVLAASFIVVAALGFTYSRDVVAPIRAMIVRFQRLQENPDEQQLPLPPRGQDEIGQLVQWFNQFLENLTERERLIADLRVANQRAEESTRLKSEFLATMSHELRTPLNAIEGFTGIMLSGMGIELDDKAQRMVERIQFNSHRLLNLINDVLDLSRIEAGRMEPVWKAVNPRALAELWRHQMGVLAEQKGLGFDVHIASDVPYSVVADENMLTKITTNLLSNAVKFTHEGHVTLELDRQDENWRIIISDTGIGIPPHAQQIIFEEFRQVDQSTTREYGGTGLGLAIVQRLVRSMGGTVTLHSQVDMGSVFTVSLPLHFESVPERESE